MNANRLALLGSLGCLVLLAATGCEQPLPKCTSGRGPSTATYGLKEGPASCEALKGEVFGLQVYPASKADGAADLDRQSLAIQADYLGALAQYALDFGITDPNPDHKWYSYGPFASAEPDGDDYCRVPSLSAAEQDLPEVPEVLDDPETEEDESLPAQPATSLKYEWSDVAFYVTPSALGTRYSGQVKVTVDGEACTYNAVGLYPAVFCGIPEDPEDPASAYVPDEKACAAEPDPDNGYPIGSGINPDFPVHCDPELLLCVLD